MNIALLVALLFPITLQTGAGFVPPSRGGIILMTFNIRYGTAADGENHWMLRRGLVMEVIEKNSPDLLCLQEALAFQIDAVRERFPHYGVIGVGRDDGVAGGEHCAILFRNERFIVSESGTFWFSDTPELPGSRSWGNKVTRICTWARFVDRETDRAFYLYNLHLDHESESSRDRSTRYLAERIAGRDFPDPVLVAGDFNAGPNNSAIRFLLEGEEGSDQNSREKPPIQSLRSAYLLVHTERAGIGTYHGYTGDTTGEMIDQILVSAEWKIDDAAIDRTARGGRFPSDHFPVTTRCRMVP